MPVVYTHRIIMLPALLLALALLLAACGGTSPVAEQDAPTEAPPTEEAPTEAPTEAPPTEEAPTEEAPTEEAPTEAPDPTEPQPTTSATEEATTTEPTAAPEPTEPPTATSVPPTATPSGPVVLRSGTFNFVDDLHNGTGTAQIIEQPDGSHILRLESDFSVTFGPDLFMWLAGHPEPKTGDEARNQGYVNLGGLQSRSGAQEYEIPADVNLDAYQSAVVWCRAFGQVMTSAPLDQ
jgi:hypothetical protein